MTPIWIHAAAALLPVLSLLAILVAMDAHKLIRPRLILLSFLVGILAAYFAGHLNGLVTGWLELDHRHGALYLGPVVEEILKGAWLIGIVAYRRVGFVVDAAIVGVATGAGFAAAETLGYLQAWPGAGAGIWILRGFGASLMHAVACAVMIMTAQGLRRRWGFPSYVAAALLAIVIHAIFNRMWMGPVGTAAATVALLPLILTAAYELHVRRVHRWLVSDFDSETEMLALIGSPELERTAAGAYLQSLESRFDADLVVDIFCYLRLTLELTLEAKGILLIRSRGFEVQPSADTASRIAEASRLAHNIGSAGRQAMRPLLPEGRRDAWQRTLLG